MRAAYEVSKTKKPESIVPHPAALGQAGLSSYPSQVTIAVQDAVWNVLYDAAKFAESDALYNSSFKSSTGNWDGEYGPGTRAAVKVFQKMKGLSETGELDGATLDALGLTEYKAMLSGTAAPIPGATTGQMVFSNKVTEFLYKYWMPVALGVVGVAVVLSEKSKSKGEA